MREPAFLQCRPCCRCRQCRPRVAWVWPGIRPLLPGTRPSPQRTRLSGMRPSGGAAFSGRTGLHDRRGRISAGEPRCTWWFVALFVVSTSVLLLGLLGLSHEWLGFPRSWIVPKAERDARRAEHELTRLIERSQFRDSLQELLDELENNRRDLEIQLGTSSYTACSFRGPHGPRTSMSSAPINTQPHASWSMTRISGLMRSTRRLWSGSTLRQPVMST